MSRMLSRVSEASLTVCSTCFRGPDRLRRFSLRVSSKSVSGADGASGAAGDLDLDVEAAGGSLASSVRKRMRTVSSVSPFFFAQDWMCFIFSLTVLRAVHASSQETHLSRRDSSASVKSSAKRWVDVTVRFIPDVTSGV